MHVVIPAAGKGTRFYPVTKTMPKEMLPVLNRPVIQYVVEEAIAAGARELSIVTGPTKRDIEKYFEEEGDATGSRSPRADDPLLALRQLRERATFRFFDQNGVSGLGGAILSVGPAVRSRPFAVLLGDSIHVCDPPLLVQLQAVFEEYGRSRTVVALEMVPPDRVSWYGIVHGTEVRPGVLEIDDLVEKPPADRAPSRYAVTGAYYCTPDVLDVLRDTAPDSTGEVQMTDALRVLARRGKVVGLIFRGKRYDAGNPVAWLEANFMLATRDPAYRPLLESLLRQFGAADPSSGSA